MLEVRSLTKYYGALPALRDASFIARPWQILSDGKVVANDTVDRLRGLQKDATLEHVFVKLAVRSSVDDAAKAIVETVKL